MNSFPHSLQFASPMPSHPSICINSNLIIIYTGEVEKGNKFDRRNFFSDGGKSGRILWVVIKY